MSSGKTIRVLAQILAVLLAMVYLVPIYMTLITSLKAPAEINVMTAWALPSKAHWASYGVAWERFAPNLQNSFVLAISATLLSAIMGSLNGYVLSKYRIPGESGLAPDCLWYVHPLPERTGSPLQVHAADQTLRGPTRFDPGARGLRAAHNYPAFSQFLSGNTG